MKNKQIVIELHEGCINPDDPVFTQLQAGSWEQGAEKVKDWLKDRLNTDPDSINIDSVEVIDCDCDVEE